MRLPFLIAAISLHKTLKYKHTFTYKHMFLYCEDVRLQAYSLILLGMHVQCIGDYCGGRGL